MSNLDNEPEVGIVKQKLADLGIPINSYIENITFVYKRPQPIGFRFVCKTPNMLFMELKYNRHFGIDNPQNQLLPANIVGHIAASQSRGLSIRQISDYGSLHFNISSNISGATNDNCEVHFDTVSISHGLADDGTVIYNLENLTEHWTKDLLGVPNLSVRGAKDFIGLTVGWNF